MADKYIKATATIYFEPDHVGCNWCPLLETYSRNKCRISAEYITDPRVYGQWCPLKLEEDADGKREIT